MRVTHPHAKIGFFTCGRLSHPHEKIKNRNNKKNKIKTLPWNPNPAIAGPRPAVAGDGSRRPRLGERCCHRRHCHRIARGPPLSLPPCLSPASVIPAIAGDASALSAVAGNGSSLPAVTGDGFALPAVAGDGSSLPPPL